MKRILEPFVRRRWHRKKGATRNPQYNRRGVARKLVIQNSPARHVRGSLRIYDLYPELCSVPQSLQFGHCLRLKEETESLAHVDLHVVCEVWLDVRAVDFDYREATVILEHNREE